MVVGRNPVFEALRDGVPATTLYVQQFIDNDERVRDALKLAGERGNINLMEAPRPELDRMTNGLNHQGLVLQVPPYEYAHPEDLTEAAHDNGEDPLIVALDGVTDPATSARSSAPSPPSAATAWSSPSAAPPV